VNNCPPDANTKMKSTITRHVVNGVLLDGPRLWDFLNLQAIIFIPFETF
jgi:hypothetical protein